MRAAVLTYAVAGFILLLLADGLGLVLALPVWLHPLLIKTVLAGLPITIVLSWHFDLRRDIRPVGGRDLDAIDEEERLRASSLLKMSGLVAAVLLVTFTAAAVHTIREREPLAERSRIVIAPLENRTRYAELDALGPAAAEWITQRLIQTRQIDIVPANSAIAYGSVNPLQSRQTRARAIELGRGVGAGLVLWGTFHVRGDSLLFITQIANAHTGDVVRNLPAAALALARAGVDLPRFGEHVSFAVARYFGAKLSAWPPSLRQPPALAAYSHFHAGARHYARREYSAALQRFADAASLDSSFVLARIWLARTLIERRELARAQTIAHSLEPYRGTLTTYDRALLDHVQAESRSDIELRYAAATVMTTVAPASDDAVRLLAVDALAMNHPREARGLLESIDPLRGSVRGRPDYYAYLAAAQHLVGNHREELRVVERGLQRFPQSLGILVARCRAQAALHDVDGVKETGSYIASNAYKPEREPIDPGAALLICAQELVAHGDGAGIRDIARSADAWYARRQTLTPMSSADRALVLVLLNRGAEAYELMKQAAALGTSPAETALLRARLARIAALTGRHKEAAALEAAAAALPDDLASPYITLERARTLVPLGDTARGFVVFRDAFGEGLPYADPYRSLPHADYEFARLGAQPGLRAVLQPRG